MYPCLNPKARSVKEEKAAEPEKPTGSSEIDVEAEAVEVILL